MADPKSTDSTPVVDASDLPPLNVGAGGAGMGALVDWSGSNIAGMPGQDKALLGGGETLYRERVGEESREMSDLDRQMAGDRQRMQKMWDAEEHSPGTLQDWNADAMRDKYATRPVQAFGSIGSVFAILASAFTHQPMINALNGSAAAMNALKQNNDEEYQRSFAAWKANTDLAIKRQQMQRELYSDAFELLRTDMETGATKMKESALRFGDQQALFFIQNGMWDKLDQLMESRTKASEGLVDLRDKLTDSNMRNWAYKQSPAGQDPNAPAAQKYMAWKAAHGISNQWQNNIIDNFVLEHAKDPDVVEKAAALAQQLRTGYGGAGTISAERDIEQSVQRKRQEWTAQGISPDQQDKMAADYRRDLRTQSAGLTGTGAERLKSHIEQFDNSLQKIDEVTNVLDHYVGAAGIAGKATRTAERVHDIFGSNDTDRVQLMRNIEYLQAVAPQLLLDRSSGRPLSAEAGRINDIIAGLNMGDTTANTLRSMKEVKTLYEKMKNDAQGRLGGGTPDDNKPADKKKSDAPWANDPVVQ